MKQAVLILSLFICAGIGNARPVTHHLIDKTDSVYICKSPSAYAYHQYACRGLKRCTHVIEKIPVKEAIRLGYKACKICYR